MKSNTLAGGIIALSLVSSIFGSTTYAYTGSAQTFTVPTTGTYTIVAFGAQGASSGANDSGGKGAEIGDTFTFTAGEVLTVDVGGTPGLPGGYGGGGGGGGTFVVDSTIAKIVLIAGGGGGGALASNGGGSNLLSLDGSGGSGGSGTVTAGGGGGGGGYFSDGNAGGPGSVGGAGGGHFSGLQAGAGGAGPSVGGNGGYGGGGGGGAGPIAGSFGNSGGGGGGGGFTGGAGGDVSAGPVGGRGGTSFDPLNNSNPLIFVASQNTGNGSVTITFDAPAVPEPATSVVFITGLACIFALRRARPWIAHPATSRARVYPPADKRR